MPSSRWVMVVLPERHRWVMLQNSMFVFSTICCMRFQMVLTAADCSFASPVERVE